MVTGGGYRARPGVVFGSHIFIQAAVLADKRRSTVTRLALLITDGPPAASICPLESVARSRIYMHIT